MVGGVRWFAVSMICRRYATGGSLLWREEEKWEVHPVSQLQREFATQLFSVSSDFWDGQGAGIIWMPGSGNKGEGAACCCGTKDIAVLRTPEETRHYELLKMKPAGPSTWEIPCAGPEKSRHTPKSFRGPQNLQPG